MCTSEHGDAIDMLEVTLALSYSSSKLIQMFML